MRKNASSHLGLGMLPNSGVLVWHEGGSGFSPQNFEKTSRPVREEEDGVEKACWKKSALASTDCCQASLGIRLGHPNQPAPRLCGLEGVKTLAWSLCSFLLKSHREPALAPGPVSRAVFISSHIGMQGTVPGSATCPHASPLLPKGDPVHTPSQEHTYETVEHARIPEEPGVGALWARGNPRSTWRNKRWGGRLSGSPRQLVEMCLLLSSCCSTSGLRSWDLFSEHFGIRQTRLPPASQLNPFAIWLMIKRVMVYTERAVKDAVCERDRHVSKPE